MTIIFQYFNSLNIKNYHHIINNIDRVTLHYLPDGTFIAIEKNVFDYLCLTYSMWEYEYWHSMHSNQGNMYFMRMEFLIKFGSRGSPFKYNYKSECQWAMLYILQKFPTGLNFSHCCLYIFSFRRWQILNIVSF